MLEEKQKSVPDSGIFYLPNPKNGKKGRKK